MLCQAKAFLPAMTNSGGTACRARSACCSAARSSSSLQLLATVVTFRCLCLSDDVGVVAEEGAQLRRAPQPLQAAGASRAHAADRDAQFRADVRIAMRRFTDQQRQQLTATARKVSERG